MVCFDVGLNVGTVAMWAMSVAPIRDGGVKSVHDHTKGLDVLAHVAQSRVTR